MSIQPRNASKLRDVANALADQAINARGVSNRGDAASALSYMTDPVAASEMARVLASGSDAGLPLIRALGQLGGPSAIKALEGAQNSPVPWIPAAAAATAQALREGKSLARPEIAD
ncbi:MAG TPA: hypothetical protein VHE09_12190 [Rhizomicrobium sp.]|nr:hypothetical protein [Rhizomicrobium sp.]